MNRQHRWTAAVVAALAVTLALSGCPAAVDPTPGDADASGTDSGATADVGRDDPDGSAGRDAPGLEDAEPDASVDCDVDGDGFDAMGCGGNDCDDGDALRYPGNVERCDGVLSDGRAAAGHDEDCDPCTVAGVAPDGDADADLYARTECENPWIDGTPPSGCDGNRTATDPGRQIVLGVDCNDDASADGMNVHPNQTEACNGRDDDCDLAADEGASVTVYPDTDGDGYGTGGGMLGCAGTAGTAPAGGDCDESDAGRNPAVSEVCDGLDNDCDGHLDGPGEDVDDDGAPTDCGGVVVGAIDCDDGNAMIAPGMTETCNRRDDDCDGTGDEGFARRDWCFDCDADGFGAEPMLCWNGCAPLYTLAQLTSIIASFGLSCAAPAWATDVGDCDDEDADAVPGGLEVCDGADNDCDGTRDDGFPTTTYYADEDGDGHGLASSATLACAAPRQHVAGPADDCDDAQAGRHPEAAETCDGGDNDCDGIADESLPLVSLYADCDGDGYGALYPSLGPGGATLACGVVAGDAEALYLTCGDVENLTWSTEATDCDDVDPARQSGC